MKILVLGGTGFVGSVIAHRFADSSSNKVTIASRRPPADSKLPALAVDGCDEDALAQAMHDMDVVINCVAGSGAVIRDNASALVAAARKNGSHSRLIHMSTMSVYGGQKGTVTESTPVSDDGNWYGQAKIDAEEIVDGYGTEGGRSTIFRIGCVYGPSSAMWVDRIGLLIKSGRLGDLGTLGDGWSNLVHVHDIARAAELSAPSDRSGTEIYNLSAPDSPRWNQYFRDFSLAIGCVPVKYKTSLSMAIESKIIAPPIKIWERLAGKRLLPAPKIQCMPPSLLRLWSQHIKLDSSKASDSLGLNWTSYDDGLAQSAESFRREYG